MDGKTSYETRRILCPEENRKAELFLTWVTVDGRRALHGVCCNNPRFAGLDNWDCEWSCLEELDTEH
jgi:hypothetical protein